ncbi:TRAP transporter substrate-binding protein DctP [Bacillus infantis]|uniref:TRAP transporter substrate-binding protein DctP n=1 Tax=Bacillus infantis TaxID=324767 RepID=UPI00165376C5|nr:TRAP transporter substrate-binding protein DctP [Bacillus infantis]
MKQKNFILTACLMILLAGCNKLETSKHVAHSAESITLRVGTGVGTTHLIYTAYLSKWMEEVENRTNGKVNFEVHYGGSVVAMGREYDALVSGIVDMVMPMFQVYDPVRFPLSEVSMLPLLESNVTTASAAYKELVMGNLPLKEGKSFYDYELKSKGLKMWTTPTTEGYNFSYANKKGPRNLTELTNVTFRSSGRVAEIFSKEIGINAIAMPAGDIYDGLSRGSIDGLYFSIPDWPGYGIDELLGYTIQGVNLGHFSHIFGMTQETWESLPHDVQEVMDEVAAELLDSKETYQFYEERMEQALNNNKKKGGVIEDMSAQPLEVQEAIDKAIVETWKKWIKMNDENGLPGKETALMWRDLIIKHGGDVPEEIKQMK